MKQRVWEEEEWKEEKKKEEKKKANNTFHSVLPRGEKGRVHKNSSSA